MSSDSASYGARIRGARRSWRALPRSLGVVRARPELLGLLGIAAILNLWGLSINGWANTFYSATVRSMTTSWHDFLFASLDRSGLMTVDKPPLSLWVQALSARVFGLHPLSLLVPEGLMGVATVGLTYDLTRRHFGRPAGFAAGIALATTPIAVAMSRHNNPDELLALCCVAALWLALRGLEDGRTRWLVWSGVCVGLGFEAKMGVALMVVPGIVAAYLWVSPRGRLVAVGQLIAGGAAVAVVGLAWPVLVTLTPAADRPWISGTSDNSVWSLIFSYNGVGRISGQSGGPQAVVGGGLGGLFGGRTGVLRLLQPALGDQAGWLLGFALVSSVGVLVSSRLRRTDVRTGWLIAIGGAFATTAVVFSFAQGIFHPYYVSFLAPFVAALLGAGVGEALSGARTARILAPGAILAGAVTELVVLGNLGASLAWAKPLVIGVGGACAVLLAVKLSGRTRPIVLAVGLAALFAAPATWAAETLGHATSGTFPTGGPASVSIGGFGGGPGFGPPGGSAFGPPGGGFRGPGGGFGGPGGGFGRPAGAPGIGFGGGFGSGRGFPGGGGFGGGSGGDSPRLNGAVSYAKAHGGGTIGVGSQSSAAQAILSSNANVAGLGGFSGRESSVTAAWVAMEVGGGRLRWILTDSGQGGRSPGDTRQGSIAAFDVVAKACRAVTFTASGSKVTMYDCQRRAAEIVAASRKM